MFKKIITFYLIRVKLLIDFSPPPSFSWTHIKCIFTIYPQFSLGGFLLWFFLFVWRFCPCINYSLAKSELEKLPHLKALVRLLELFQVGLWVASCLDVIGLILRCSISADVSESFQTSFITSGNTDLTTILVLSKIFFIIFNEENGCC